MRRIILISTLVCGLNCISQTDTVIYQPNSVFYFKGKVKNGEKIGNWYRYNEMDSIDLKLEFLIENRCKIYKELASIKIFWEGYFQFDSITLDGAYNYSDEKRKRQIFGQYCDGAKCGNWVTLSNYKFSGIETYNKQTENAARYFYSSENGNLKCLSEIDKSGKPNGIFYTFDDSLKIVENGYFLNGAKFGTWKYFNNGVLNCVGDYFPDYIYFNFELQIFTNKDGKPVKECFPSLHKQKFSIAENYYLKQGIWKYYNEKGDVVLIEKYDKGQLLKSKKIKPKKYFGNLR